MRRIVFALAALLTAGCAQSESPYHDVDANVFNAALEGALEGCLATSDTAAAWAACYGEAEVAAARRSASPEALVLFERNAQARIAYAEEADAAQADFAETFPEDPAATEVRRREALRGVAHALSRWSAYIRPNAPDRRAARTICTPVFGGGVSCFVRD